MTNEPLMDEFFKSIENLEPRLIVCLKRNLGKTLAEADAQAVAAFYSCLPDEVKAMQNRWFAAACIHCLWAPDITDRVSVPQAILRERKLSNLSDSYMRKVCALMDTPWENDGYLLSKYCGVIKTLKSKGHAINGEEVLKDLIEWNKFNIAQTRWAKILAQCE